MDAKQQAQAAQPVFALLLPEALYEYLLQVFESHTRGGIPSDELLIASELYRRLKTAQPVDFSKLGPATLEKMGPGGVSLSVPTGESDAGRQDPSSIVP
jgi:hypothetical protein